MTDTRARLTPVDVVFIGMGGALLLILGPVFLEVLDQNAGELGTMSGFLFQLVLPGLLLTLLTIVLITVEGTKP